MRRTWIAACVLAGLAAAASGGAELQWQGSYDEAVKAAAAGDKIIMALFTTTTCPYCTKLKEETLADPAVRASLKGAVLVEMQPGSPGSDELAARFMVRNVPAVFFMDAHDGLLGKISGYVPPVRFVEFVNDAKQAAGDFVRKLADYTAKPSAASGVELVDEYLKRYQRGRIRELLAAVRKLVNEDKDITQKQRLVLSARLRIAESFVVLEGAEKPDAATELLKKAEEEAAAGTDDDVAARAGFLRAVLLLEAGRIPESAVLFEAVFSSYPKTQWGALAKRYFDAVRKEMVKAVDEARSKQDLPAAGSQSP